MESFSVSEGRVTLRNNSLYSQVIGGSRAHHDQNFLSTTDAGARTSGFIVKRKDSIVLRSEHLEVGNPFQISIKRIPIWKTLLRREADYYQSEVDPFDLHDAETAKKHKGWKYIDLSLKAI